MLSPIYLLHCTEHTSTEWLLREHSYVETERGGMETPVRFHGNLVMRQQRGAEGTSTLTEDLQGHMPIAESVAASPFSTSASRLAECFYPGKLGWLISHAYF